MQERYNLIANALELRFSCINSLIWYNAKFKNTMKLSGSKGTYDICWMSISVPYTIMTWGPHMNIGL